MPFAIVDRRRFRTEKDYGRIRVQSKYLTGSAFLDRTEPIEVDPVRNNLNSGTSQ